jgi:hypothetical protein
MTTIIAILQHTPLWAFAVFVLLIVFGLQARQPRHVAIWRMVIVPAVFIGWGIVSLATRNVSAVLILDWLVAAGIGAGLGWGTTRIEGVHFDGQGGVHLPGSTLPLMRNMAIFAIKYAFAVAVAISPSQRQNIIFWDIAISGASAGYFLGWLARFALAQRRASENKLVTQA